MSKLFQKQVVSKQLAAVIASFDKGQYDSDNKQNSSIDGLLEKYVDSDPTLSDSICNAIVFLVSSQKLNINFILQKLISLLQSARNITAVLLAIRNLLRLQLEKSNAGTSYSILQSGDRNIRVHPLIQVLQTRPDAWNNVFEIVKYLFNETNRPRLEVIQLLDPVLRFVVWNPNKMDEWHHLYPYLIRFLIQQCSHLPNATIIDFMMESIFWFKFKTPGQVIENGLLLQEICEMFCFLRVGNRKLDMALMCSVATCEEMLSRNMDINGCLRTMMNLAEMLKDINMSSMGHCTLLLMGSLMQSAPVSYQKQIMTLCTLLFARKNLDPVVAVTLLPPLLDVMFAPANFIPEMNKFSAEALVIRKLTEDMLQCKSDRVEVEQESPKSFYEGNFSPSIQIATQMCTLLKSTFGCTASVQQWLNRIKEYLSLSSNREISYIVFNSICGILLHGLQDLQLAHLCIEVALLIVKVDSSKVPDLIPVLLYKINADTDPELRLHILQTFPQLATHKVYVGSVLNILQALANQKGLEAIAIRLTFSLWKQQERIFPQLQKLLVFSESDCVVRKEYGLNEILVSKAATVCQICQEQPRLYGTDLLPTLSKMVSVQSETVCALALEGIITLCKAEVVDLQTTWKVLAPKLRSDKRLLVMKKTCELLSLAKSLPLLNTQYERFLNEVLTILWKFTMHENAEVVSSAFHALGSFEQQEHLLKFFPEVVRAGIKVPSNLIATPFDKAKKPEELLSYVPGSCYVHLMQVIPHKALSGYTSFLSSLLRQEVKDLPRGVSYSAQLRSSRSSASATETSQLQPLLINYFRRNKNPSVQGGISVAALLVYEPDVKDADKDVGFINSGRDYKQVLDRLLVEVPFDASDWRRTLVLGPAWQLFMGRAYSALVQSRASELKLQYDRGMLDCSAEEYSLTQDSVWLYVRDKLTELLRSAFRGKPALQGNSVLALGSLVTAAAEYECLRREVVNVSQSADGGKHPSHGHWTKMVVESLLCLVDDTRDPRGQTFTWCHTDSSAIGSLPKSCAALALSQLSSVFVAMEVDCVHQVMDCLKVKLLTSLDNPLMHFSVGISIGSLIQGLMKFRFTDLAGEEGVSLLTEATNFLTDWCLNGKDSHVKGGPLIGLSLAVSALASDGEFAKLVLSVHKSICKMVVEEQPSSNIYEILHVCNAIVTLSSCHYDLIAAAAIQDLYSDVKDKCFRSRNNIDLATALGLICGYPKMKMPSVDADGIFKKWLAFLADENSPTLVHLSAIYGLFAMNDLGAVLNLFSTDMCSSEGHVTLRAQQTAKHMMAMVLKSCDTSVLNCSWMLGCYFQKTTDNVKSPTSYYYLANKSILRYVVDFVAKYTESDGRSFLESCLACLSQDFGRSLPPLEWNAVLGPLLGLNIAPEVNSLVMRIALNQSQNSPSALVLVNKWLYLPAFIRLHQSGQEIVLEKLPELVMIIHAKKLQVFLDNLMKHLFIRKAGPEEVLAKQLLNGLSASLKVKEPPTGITSMLYVTVGKLCTFISAFSNPLLILVCDVLGQLPEEELWRVVNFEGQQPKLVISSLYVTCRLTSCSKMPMSRLQRHIEAVSSLPRSEHDPTLDILHESLRTFAEPHVTEAAKISWTIEMMGLIKKLQLTVSADLMTTQVAYLIEVFATCIVCWSSTDIALLWHPHLPYRAQILNLFPPALPTLLGRSMWSQNTKKVIDWIVALLQDANIADDIRMSLKGALLQTRNVEEFKKLSVWTTLL